MMFEDETVHLTPGMVMLIPPAVVHGNVCPNDDSIILNYMIRSSTFRSLFLDQMSGNNIMSLFFRQALEGQNKIAYLSFDTKRDSEMKSLLFAIYDEYYADRNYGQRVISALMNLFFLRLLQRYENSATLSKYNGLHWRPEFNAIFRYIQENFQQASVHSVAEQCGYSERQIIRIVQNCTGKRFSELITQLRMEYAAKRLLASPKDTASVTAEVGFLTESSFYRAFKSYYGCTPQTYIKHNRPQ